MILLYSYWRAAFHKVLKVDVFYDWDNMKNEIGKVQKVCREEFHDI